MPTNDIQGWQTIIQAVQTIAVIVGLVFVVLQIRQQTKAISLQNETLKVSIYLEMMTEATQINDVLIKEQNIADFYDNDKVPDDLGRKWENLNGKYRSFYLYLGRILSLLERGFILRKKGLIDPPDHEAMLTQLWEVRKLRIFELWWPTLKSYYRNDFATFVDRLPSKDLGAFRYSGMALPTDQN